ncbi:hypothetical protein ACOIE4_002440 [Klebsiella variicola]|uniref:hypothetical protein n=1 Tax=Klebsiella TaxID=570 RepID=UPI000C7DB78A|nr:hypothetical protein [Klebsiella variicola]EIW9272235.1 hypothetical protein [Klebsiella variicola]EIY5099951.1 hypothetical protein [Klebsiella variicola]EKZ6631151.1 hypothetical protein [Klebsiella variicola]MBM4735069.1 hypothetical protein [Klebsiella variicola]MBM7148563.1 hypothetical protein [Klebsiella variicola]
MNNISKAMKVVELVGGEEATHALPVEKVAVYSTLLANAGDSVDEQCYAAFHIRRDLAPTTTNNDVTAFYADVQAAFAAIDSQSGAFPV